MPKPNYSLTSPTQCVRHFSRAVPVASNLVKKPVLRKAKKKKPRARRPHCPACSGREVVAVLHGLITPILQRAINAGRAMIADREEWEGMSEWYCKICGCDWSRHSRRFKKPGGVNATRSN